MFGRRLYVVCFALVAAATIAPIWLGRYVPLLDLPNHLSAIAIWHYHDDPKWDFAKHYDLNLVPLPYWAHYYSVHLLTYLTRSVEVANKIFLSAYALAVPVGAGVLARRFDRSPWLAFLAFPLVWNFNLADGFVAYCAGFAALPFALALVDKYAERPTWRLGLAAAAAGTLTYFFHLLSYVLFLVCGGLVALAQRRPRAPRLLAVRAAPVLASAGIGLWAWRYSNRMDFHAVRGVPHAFVRDSLADTVAVIPDRLFYFIPGPIEHQLWMVLAGATAALVVTGWFVRGEPSARGRWHAWGIELCLAAALALYLIVPRSMRQPFYWHMINARFVVAAALFAVLAPRGAMGWWRRALLAPVVVVHLMYMVALSRAFVTFNHDADGLDAVVDQVPPGAQVMTLILPPMGDDALRASVFNQFPSYVQVRRGGYNHYNFAEGFPIKYKHYLPATMWSHAEKFSWEYHSRGWDYFLTFREGREASPLAPLVTDGEVKLVAQQGVWKLYQKLIPDPPLPAPEPREP